MRTLKIFFSTLILMFFNMGFAFSDITQSAPTNLISSIASATSFTSLEQISPEATVEIQSATSSIVDSDALQAEVQESAEAFGEMVNQMALEVDVGSKDGKKKFLTIGGEKNEYEDKDNLEPTLGTIAYDTGMVNMSREGGHYDTDNLDPSGNSKTIFDSTTGAQQARVKVYIDFNRQVLFGSIESKITLSDGTVMTNTYNGRSATIDKNTLPVDKRLTFTMSSSTGDPLALNAPGEVGECGDAGITCPDTTNLLQPFVPEKVNDAFRNSLLDENGERQAYLSAGEGGTPELDQTDMQKSISHGTGGDKDVLVLGRFLTAGSDGTPGKSFAAFEAFNGVPCADSDQCTTAEKNAFKDGIERYSTGIITTTATKITEELPQ